MPSQEQLTEQFDEAVEEDFLDSALTRAVRLMAEERERLGHVTPELKAMILDEELTPVLEVVVDQTREAYGVVPRSFRVQGDDLIDPHDQSLAEVADRGREWSRQEVVKEVPGAWRELQRRTAEANNIATIAQMPPGTLCIEVSANPIDWTEEERESQHYTGLTMIRASLKPLDSPNEVIQLNFVLPELDAPEAILNLQQKLDIEPGEQTIDTQRLLANPKLVEFDGSVTEAGREVDGLLGAVLLEKSVGHSTLRMIKRAIERRRETWRFITSADQSDVHEELLAHIERLSFAHPQLWEHGMAGIRTGFTKELKDRFLGREQLVTESTTPTVSILEAAAERAVLAGDVYVACGTTVNATALGESQSATPAQRAEVVASLRTEIKGKGTCNGCGTTGLLYGCGIFCYSCNKKWCDEFVATGKQLEANELAFFSSLVKPSTERATPKSSSGIGLVEGLSAELAEIDKRRKAKLEADKLKP